MPLPKDNQRDVSKGVVDVLRSLQVRLRRLESLPVNDTIVVLGDKVLTAVAANFDFTDISQDYRHLMLILSLRSVDAATIDYPAIQFNGDTGANYDSIRTTWWHSSGFGTVQALAATTTNMNEMPANTAPANEFGVATIKIPDYISSVKNKELHGEGGLIRDTGTGNILKSGAFGSWKDTSAITRIVIATLSTSNWAVGSRITLYGVR